MAASSDLEDEIRACLAAEFPGDEFSLEDQSAAHYGHAGAMEHGGKHFALRLVSGKFSGLSRVKRHQIIYKVLETQFANKSIHALKLNLLTAEEDRQTS